MKSNRITREGVASPALRHTRAISLQDPFPIRRQREKTLAGALPRAQSSISLRFCLLVRSSDSLAEECIGEVEAREGRQQRDGGHLTLKE
jgi:hypothetical protein